MSTKSPNLISTFDPSLDSFDNLVGLIKANNPPGVLANAISQGFDATRRHVRFDPVVTSAPDEKDRNTHVRMSTNPGYATGGPWNLHYHRPSFKKLMVVDTVDFVYELQPSDLDVTETKLKDPQALKHAILCVLFGVASVGCADEFIISIASDYTRPKTGIETFATLTVINGSWLFIEEEIINFILRWPTDAKVVDLNKVITNTQLGAFSG